jgi:hypothetical protein
MTMNKELDFEVEDLGTASIETKGPPSALSEFGGQVQIHGISDAD